MGAPLVLSSLVVLSVIGAWWAAAATEGATALGPTSRHGKPVQ